MNQVVAQGANSLTPTHQQQMPAITPMQMLEMAVQQGADLDKLQQLMDLQERWEANEARKAFVIAMAAFKAEQIEILKTKRVQYTTDRGTTEYSHADLADVIELVVPKMSKYGLSHRWDTQQADGKITVSCVITHEKGHSERTTLTASPDASGGKNSIQSIGSAVSYLQRYTFMAATGLAAKDMDDDGRKAGATATSDGTKEGCVTREQADTLTQLCKKADVPIARMIHFALHGMANDNATVFDIPANKYHACVNKLNTTIKARGGNTQ